MAAIDCDDDANKQLCGSMGVKGFPTLKIVRPGKKNGKPIVEDYNNQRTASAITEAVASKINNHVTRVADKDLDAFLTGDKPKAILFTQKGTTSALIRSLAIDFLDVISVAQIRDKETNAVSKFGIEKFPALVLIPGQDQEPIVYDGELKKKDMVAFLSQAAKPNSSSSGNGKAESKGKKAKKGEKKEKNEKKEESETTKAVKEEPIADTEESTDEKDNAGSPSAPVLHDISKIESLEKLTEQCLGPKSHTCVLVFSPTGSTDGAQAIDSLTHINTKYINTHRPLFPLIAIPSDSEAASTLPKTLELKDDANLVAINTRRNWWRQYEGDFSLNSVEAWIDAIRLGEGAKKKLPAGVVAQPKAEPVEESSVDELTQATDPEPEIETDAPEAEPEIEPQAEVNDKTKTEDEPEVETQAVPEAEPIAEVELEPETDAPSAEAEEIPKEEIKHEEL